MAAKKKKGAKKFKVEEVTEEPASEETAKTLPVAEKAAEVEKTVTEPAKPVTPPTEDQKISSFKLADIDKVETEKKEVKEQEPLAKEVPKTEVADHLPEVKTEEPKKDEESKTDTQEWLKDVDSETSDEGGGKSKKKKVFFIVLILIVILAVISGGVYYYQTNIKTKSEEEVKVENEEQVVEAEPTAVPTQKDAEEIDPAEYSLNILNGSGIAGEAGKVENLLTAAGFEGIETGNADSYDYVETEVSYKEDASEAVYDFIKDALKSDYIVSKSETNLSEDSEYDVVITVGSKKLESDAETATESAE